jgi:hypothetical protein
MIAVLRIGGAIVLLGLPLIFADYLLRKGNEYAPQIWLLSSFVIWLVYLYLLFRLCMYLLGW